MSTLQAPDVVPVCPWAVTSVSAGGISPVSAIGDPPDGSQYPAPSGRNQRVFLAPEVRGVETLRDPLLELFEITPKELLFPGRVR